MDLQMPFDMHVDLRTGHMSSYERHNARYGRDMRGYFEEQLPGDDVLIYEFFEREVPAESGQIVQDVTLVYPGTVGDEYFMTKGHYHANEQASEVYLCLNGEGFLLMQTKAGHWDAKPLKRGVAVYVPPGWAHRSVNTGSEPLVLYALYPADSGHDYGTIERHGFLKRVVRGHNGKPVFVNNET